MVKRGFSVGIKNYLTLGLSTFITSGVGAIFWMYLASVVGKTSYGELGFLMSVANVGLAVATIGLGRMMVVYGAKNENVFSPAYAMGLISITAVSIITYAIIQNVAVSFLIFGMMIFYLNESDLTSKKRFVDVSKFKLLRTALTIIFAIILYQSFGVNGIVLGYALATLPTLRGFYIFARTKKIGISVLKPKIGFMLNNWFSALATNLFFWGDKIIIGSLLGFSTLGSYQLASQYFMLLSTFPTAVSIYLLPHESQGIGNKKIKFFSLGIACTIALMSIIVIPYAVGFFFSNYNESIVPMQIMSVGIIPFTISSIQESQFLGNERSKIVLVGSTLGVGSYFLLIMLFGTQFGLVALAGAFLASTIIRAIFNTVVSRLHSERYHKNCP